MKVSGLYIYPAKSSRGVSLDKAEVERDGLAGDRRWVIIDEDGVFISQRSHPDLARLDVTLRDTGLTLRYDGDHINVTVPTGDLTTLYVWTDKASGHVASRRANDWLSACFGQPLRLVFMGPNAKRSHAHPETGAPISSSYADAYPILIATEASLQALNDYLGPTEPDLPMSRFRPNIVIQGAAAWGEDGWSKLRVGNTILTLIKPCTRCIMTTLNPMTGQSEGDAAMRALIALRRSGDPRAKGVLFGWNAVPDQLGSISLGDLVERLESRDPWPVQNGDLDYKK